LIKRFSWLLSFLTLLTFTQICIAASGAAQIPLTLTPIDLPDAADMPISQLSLMRWRGDRFEPVPFQIDEVDEHGMVWFDGSGFKRQGEAGIFDGADQLLVMYEDAGDQKSAESRLVSGQLLAEIKVVSPSSMDAYFYLVQNNAQRSAVRYIEHDPATGVTRTPYYFLTTDPANELNWEHLGYDGYTGPADASIIDTLKMRMSGGIFFRFARMTLDNDNLKPRRRGFRIGPIRSVMHLETSVVFAGLPVMKMHVQAIRYPNQFEAHTYSRIPVLYRKSVKAPQVVVSVDGNSLLGATVQTAAGGELTAQVDGRIDEQELRLLDSPLSTDDSWIIFDSGNQFALLTELLVPKDLQGIPLQLIYQDDKTLENQPENYPGQLPNLGYALNGWPKANELNFSVRLLFFSHLPQQDLASFAALRSGRALHVTSRPVSQ
jgi:hypothetical protein